MHLIISLTLYVDHNYDPHFRIIQNADIVLTSLAQIIALLIGMYLLVYLVNLYRYPSRGNIYIPRYANYVFADPTYKARFEIKKTNLT